MNTYFASKTFRSFGCLLVCCGLFEVATAQVASQEPTASNLADRFDRDVAQFMSNHCLDCHGEDEPDAALNLAAFDSADSVVEHFATWNLIKQRVEAGEMPPRDVGAEISAADKQVFLGWIDELRADHIKQHAGDPGEVLARRLSAAEYDYTIRDLTGVDIRPAAQFPIDPSNEAGFDNSGESLIMTPSLLNKYIDAARTVASHLLFLPDRLDFAPHPVVTETDRDKYCVRQIVDFYDRQNTRLADYFFAAWQLQANNERSISLSKALSTLAPFDTKSRQLSEKYLRTILDLLQSDDHHFGPIRELREGFRDLPADSDAARKSCVALAERVQADRAKFTFEFPHLRAPRINRGSQSFVLWRNRQKAEHRMALNVEALDRQIDESDSVDSERRDPQTKAYEQFCRIFPNKFYVDRRGREYVDQEEEQNEVESNYRLLSAGFHSMMGYFRDDQPLCELLLTDEEKQHLDDLWFALDYVADAPRRQHAGFIWFERAEGHFLTDAEFDDFRSADKNAASEELIARLRDAYLAKTERLGADDVVQRAIRDHFRIINASIRAVEEAEEKARDLHVAMLPKLAERAFCRPLTSEERTETIAFYQQLVDVDGLSHRDAVRDVLVSILMSPHFCYRLHPTDSDEPIHRLGNYQLASRLSYFLWSSMPDEELLSVASTKRLSEPSILRKQVRRMLRSPKARGLATEFAGNWLGFRLFESHNSVDRTRFTQFDDALRQSMFEEPIRFTTDVIQNNRSVLDFLYADHTFVDRHLAKHYEIKKDLKFVDEWAQVEDADEFGRGGILPMSVFLTKNSPGLRTSPVKRGFWVVRQLLGTHIPAPPPNVPELPEDESKLGELTLRQMLANHRAHESCAGCHEKFDSVGLVFEGFGPIGERRLKDLAGNSVDLRADFPDGSQREGVRGLQDYIRDKRQDEFIDTLCRKLLSYGLGRSLILSDEPLIESMQEDLKKAEHSFHTLIESIVLSPQFLNQRGIAFEAN